MSHRDMDIRGPGGSRFDVRRDPGYHRDGMERASPPLQRDRMRRGSPSRGRVRGSSPPPLPRDRPRGGSPLLSHRERLRRESPLPRERLRGPSPLPFSRERVRGNLSPLRRDRMRVLSPPLPPERNRRRGVSPQQKERTRGEDFLLVRDRMREEDGLHHRDRDRGRDVGPWVSPPRRHHSRSPLRGSRHPLDHDYVSRSLDGHMLSAPGRDISSVRSPQFASQGLSKAVPGEQIVDYTGGSPVGIRNGTLGRQVGPPFSSSVGAKVGGGISSSQADQTPLDSYGMLVPCPIVLEDGTVRTFYSLPPDPSSSSLPPSLTDNGTAERGFQPYSETASVYGVEPADARFATLGTFGPEGPKGDFLHNPRLGIGGQKQIITEDRGLSVRGDRREIDVPSSRRERPYSPHSNGLDLHPQKRAFSPHNVIPRFSTEGLSAISSRGVYTSEAEWPARTTAGDHNPGTPTRGRFGSPPRRKYANEDVRLVGAPKDGPGYGRQNDILTDSRERHLGMESNARLGVASDDYTRSLHMNDFRDVQAYERRKVGSLRQTRSPSIEAAVDYARGRGSLFRGDIGSPRRIATHFSPKQGSRIEPHLHMYEHERKAWKRKHSELLEDFHKEERLLHREPFKRRGGEEDFSSDIYMQSRRLSEWDRYDEYFDRQDDEFAHGNHLNHRQWEERGSPSRSSRRLSPPHELGRRRSGFSDWDGPIHFPGKSYTVQKEGIGIPERNRLLRESDMRSEVLQEGGQHIAPDFPEGSSEFKQHVHRAFMKYAKALNENPGQRKVYEEQGKAGTLLCVACSRFSKPFVDTHSLVMHTYMSQKRGLRAEHLGLCKAICTLMGWSSEIEPATGKAYQQITADEVKANREDLILWPPAVVIHNVFEENSADGQQQDIADVAVRELLKDSGLSHERIKIVVGKHGTVIVKYLPTFSCLNEAERLHHHFAASCHGRDDWQQECKFQKASDTHNAQKGTDLNQGKGEKSKKTSVLYGYLALAQDLDKVDLEFRRRCVVKSRKEIEAIADVTLTGQKP